MAKTATLTNGRINRLDAVPEYKEAETRLRALSAKLAELDAIEREYQATRRETLDAWHGARVQALAAGKPEPSPPASLLPEALEFREVHHRAATTLRARLAEIQAEHTGRMRDETRPAREELARRYARGLLDAAEALEDQARFFDGLADAGIQTGLIHSVAVHRPGDLRDAAARVVDEFRTFDGVSIKP